MVTRGGPRPKMTARVTYDLRIDCTTGEAPDVKHHHLWVGGNLLADHYRRLAHQDYRVGSTFHRNGMDFRVTGCALVTCTVLTEEVFTT